MGSGHWYCTSDHEPVLGSIPNSSLTSGHDLFEHLELARGVKGDEVHAPVPAEVAPIEPVPVLDNELLDVANRTTSKSKDAKGHLKLVPRLPPAEEVVVVPDLHVAFP